MLQLCRAEISNAEWYAANLINDPNYTPKPITEIFTTDLTFIPKNPSISTQISPRETSSPTISTTVTTSTTPPITTTQEVVTEQATQIVQVIPQQQETFRPNTNVPTFVLVYDPRQQTNQLFQQPIVTSVPVQSVTRPAVEEITTASVTETPSTTTSTPSPPTSTRQTTQGPTIVLRQNQNQNPSNLPIIPIGLIPSSWNGNTVVPISNIPIINTNSVSAPPTANNTQLAQTIRPETRRPLLTVRVKSAKGAITNIKINPTTTTRRPTTTRRRKSNRGKNDYETCLDSCNGRKEPICSSPMGVFPIDPDRLKGFASLCHMACHNSFRRDRKY